MRIDIISNITRLTAETNMALRHKDGSDGDRTTITEVWIGPSDSVENWEDCEYDEPIVSEDCI